MSKENSDKSVLVGVFVLIGFAIYVLGVIHTANNFSKDKALSAFLIPPYGFYMGVKAIFNSNPQKDAFDAENHNSENQSEIERLAKENVENQLTKAKETSLDNSHGGESSTTANLEIMNKLVANMNQGLPHIENGYRLDKVEVLNDHTYAYYGTYITIPTYISDLQNNFDLIKQQTVQNVCSDPQGFKAAESGAYAVFNSYAMDGSLLISVEITPADCGY